MSPEENKAVVERALAEFYNPGDLAVADELFAPDFVNHDPVAPDVRDREGLKRLTAAHHAAFEDYQTAIEELIAAGDKVVKRWTFRGTQQGEWNGIPPTGKQVTITGITIYRLEDGKIKECWWGYDALGVLQQLGVIPVPQAAAG